MVSRMLTMDAATGLNFFTFWQHLGGNFPANR